MQLEFERCFTNSGFRSKVWLRSGSIRRYSPSSLILFVRFGRDRSEFPFCPEIFIFFKNG